MNWRTRWAAPKLLKEMSSDVSLSFRFQSQTGRAGLGRGDFVVSLTRNEFLTSALSAQEESKRLTHAPCLTRQGAWTCWEGVRPFDLSWKNLIYGPGPKLISFVLNSSLNSLKSPDMMKLWGYLPTAHVSTLFHPSLYSFSHLGELSLCSSGWSLHLETRLRSEKHPKLSPTTNKLRQQKSHHPAFVRQGQHRKVTPEDVPSLLSTSNDWKMDYQDNQLVFPPLIVATDLRPDVVIWSVRTRQVLVLELAEENMQNALNRKEIKYSELMDSIPKNWNPTLVTLEVGARGMMSRRAFQVLRRFCPSVRQVSLLCRNLSCVCPLFSRNLPITQEHILSPS